MPHHQISRRTAGAYLAAAAAAAAAPLSGCASVDRLPAAAALPPDITVAADGSGQFRSVHDALQSIPAGNRERVVVAVKDGIYRERARVDAPFVTLRGQSRLGARIEFPHPASAPIDAKGRAVLDIGPTAHDLVIENLSIENTNPQLGQHAFAILGRADRTLIQDCEVLSLGNDTLALWRGAASAEDLAAGGRPAHGGRYYHARLNIRGSVDFVCPRGWCYMVDSTLRQMNPDTTAAMWHDGRDNPDKKFVMRRSQFDGPPGWYVARRHHDGQFIFIDCRFSERMRDRAPYRVTYPLGSATPTAADIENNQRYAATNRFGDRNYFHGCSRGSSDYAWLRDNLQQAVGAPRPEQVNARWTFDGSWDPERSDGPQLSAARATANGFELSFDESVTAKGAPQLVLADGSSARFAGGSGSRRLAWTSTGPIAAQALSRLTLRSGALIGTEAATTVRHASLVAHGA